MNKYMELKERQQKEINEFPIVFAFNGEQFREGMEKLGLKVEDTDKIYHVGGGGYIRRTDSKAFKELFDRFEREMKEAIANDETGDGFIYDMFNYELANHEYSYTMELEDTLDALGMDMKQIKADERLMHGLKKAMMNQVAEE